MSIPPKQVGIWGVAVCVPLGVQTDQPIPFRAKASTRALTICSPALIGLVVTIFSSRSS